MLRLLRPPMSPYSRQRLHPRLWIIFAIIATACCLFTDRQCRIYRDRQQVCSNECARLTRIEQDLFAPFASLPQPSSKVYDSLIKVSERLPYLFLRQMFRTAVFDIQMAKENITIRKAEILLNGGHPFEVVRESREVQHYGPWMREDVQQTVKCCTVRLDDPQGRIREELRFRDGIYVGCIRTWPIVQPPKPILLHAWYFNSARHNVIAASPWVWGLFLLIAVCSSKRRFLAVELSLMWLIVTALIRIPPPALHTQWAETLKNPYWPWLLTMTCGSLTVLAWGWFAQSAKHRLLCPVCEYNLAGNRSGICPECGTPVPVEILERVQRQPRPDAARPEEHSPILLVKEGS